MNPSARLAGAGQRAIPAPPFLLFDPTIEPAADELRREFAAAPTRARALLQRASGTEIAEWLADALAASDACAECGDRRRGRSLAPLLAVRAEVEAQYRATIREAEVRMTRGGSLDDVECALLAQDYLGVLRAAIGVPFLRALEALLTGEAAEQWQTAAQAARMRATQRTLQRAAQRRGDGTRVPRAIPLDLLASVA